MLSAHLEHGGVAVIHAAEEGDADVVIVRKAIELGEHEDVVVIADDTDILVLVVYHAHSSHQFYMETKHHTIAIDTAKQALGVDVCRSQLFVHATTGCDTTSAMFGVGKTKAFKVLKASEELSAEVLMFGDVTTPKDVLFKIGDKFISALNVEVKTVSMRFVPLERMPQQVGHATTIASGYTYKWSHGVPLNHSSLNHSSAQTNLASSLRMEHLCQSSQTRLQHHQKCSGKSVVPAS